MVPFGVVTVSAPVLAPEGMVTCRYCAAFTVKLAGTEPKVTAVVPRKFFPVMITVSPEDPIAGESFVIEGCGFGRPRSRLKIVAPTNVPGLFAYRPVVDP